MPRRAAADERPAARPEGSRAERRRRRRGHRPRQERREPPHPPGRGCRPEIHAARGRSPHRGRNRTASRLDRSGRRVDRTRPALVVPENSAPRRARRARSRLGAERRGQLHPRAPRSRENCALPRSAETHPAPPRQPRSYRPSPTPEQVREYLDDKRPDAYERLVDRLLDSPHYGEKWARYWLDLARYADSDGYEKIARAPGPGAIATG